VTETPTVRIRAAGLRVTPGRIAVIETLESLGGHRTAEEISRDLARRGVSVARATVFNALDDLTAAGLVMVADAGPGPTRYEVAGSYHHHFVCSVCGAISDVPCPDGNGHCLNPGDVDGTIDGVQVIYRGVCSRCAASNT
jgi:Fur family ferric uptake transcriptional regulator